MTLSLLPLLPYLISGLLYIPFPRKARLQRPKGQGGPGSTLSCLELWLESPLAHAFLLALLPVNKYCGPHGSSLFYFLSGQDSSKGEAMASWAHSEDSRKASGLFTQG